MSYDHVSRPCRHEIVWTHQLVPQLAALFIEAAIAAAGELK